MGELNMANLRVGDYILTTSHTPLAWAIACRSAGIRKAWGMKVATHAGQIFSMNPNESDRYYFIAEMLSTIQCTAITIYNRPDFWGNKIIRVMRNPLYDDASKRQALNARIIKDVAAGVRYDYKGILEYLWPSVKDRPDEYYCSEYLRHNAQVDGGDIINVGLKQDDDINPYQIQTATNLLTVWER
jgi:hypothetical protein